MSFAIVVAGIAFVLSVAAAVCAFVAVRGLTREFERELTWQRHELVVNLAQQLVKFEPGDDVVTTVAWGKLPSLRVLKRKKDVTGTPWSAHIFDNGGPICGGPIWSTKAPRGIHDAQQVGSSDSEDENHG